MEYNIGIEMRDEYKSMEVAKGAMQLVRDIMLTKPGRNLVVTWTPPPICEWPRR